MISLYFGSPGCGKSSIGVLKARKALKRRFIFGRKYKHVVSNYPIDLPRVTYESNIKLVGEKFVYPRKTLVLIDEAGIDYNNRSYKDLSPYQIDYFKRHRHYEHDIILLSQSWEDVDVTLRRLCTELWHLKKIGPFTRARKVRKFVDTDNDTKQIVDGYEFEPLWKLLFFQPVIHFYWRPKAYKYFDSYSVNETLPIKRLF